MFGLNQIGGLLHLGIKKKRELQTTVDKERKELITKLSEEM